MIVFTVLGAWLLADFMAGIIHWVEDKIFINSTMHIFESLEADNDLHHAKPQAMLTYSYWGNISTSVIFTIPLTLLCLYTQAPLVFTLAIFFSTFGNLVHRFAHTHPYSLNRFVKFMQWTGLFISRKHHNEHHFERYLLTKAQAYRRYCPMTNWLNPILDEIGFFKFLEWLFVSR